MHRRTYILTLPTVGLISSVSGCVSKIIGEPIELHVLNWSQGDELIEVILLKNNEEVYRDTFELAGSETTRITDVASPGEYQVRASVVSGPSEDFHFTMDGCNDQEITVLYENKHELNIHSKKC